MEENRRKEISKGSWKKEEDAILIDYINKNGPRNWNSIQAEGLLSRDGKSCRFRWQNKLRPNLKKGCKFSSEEERMVIEMQEKIGNKWAQIATNLPGRTDNDVKNFWSSRQKRLARSNAIPCSSSNTTSTFQRPGPLENSSIDQGIENPLRFTNPNLGQEVEKMEDSYTFDSIQEDLGLHGWAPPIEKNFFDYISDDKVPPMMYL